jgi:hypothetical protein
MAAIVRGTVWHTCWKRGVYFATHNTIRQHRDSHPPDSPVLHEVLKEREFGLRLKRNKNFVMWEKEDSVGVWKKKLKKRKEEWNIALWAYLVDVGYKLNNVKSLILFLLFPLLLLFSISIMIFFIN